MVVGILKIGPHAVIRCWVQWDAPLRECGTAVENLGHDALPKPNLRPTSLTYSGLIFFEMEQLRHFAGNMEACP